MVCWNKKKTDSRVGLCKETWNKTALYKVTSYNLRASSFKFSITTDRYNTINQYKHFNFLLLINTFNFNKSYPKKFIIIKSKIHKHYTMHTIRLKYLYGAAENQKKDQVIYFSYASVLRTVSDDFLCL